MSVFELDLTPGAFRTLAELCRMANREGQCWPSLAQLGDRLGRSRAAVSGYISELREEGLIETETQKMANGYNYRLRYRVVFWAAWRRQLSQNTERSVKPTERPLRTQNYNHRNQSPAKAVMDDLVLAWKRCVGRAPYPAFDTWPTDDLLKNSRAVEAQPQIISADIIRSFTEFLEEKGVSGAALSPAARQWLGASFSDSEQVSAFLGALEKIWRPHWANPPSLLQLKRLAKSLPPQNSAAARAKLLASYLKRWEAHSQSLFLASGRAKVAA